MLREYYKNVKTISRNARLFMVGSFFVAFGMAVFMLLFNLYLKERQFDEAQIGTVLMASSLGAALGAIPAALLIEQLHIKHILIGAIVFTAIANALQIGSGPLGIIALWGFLGAIMMTASRVAASPFFMRNSTHKERMHLFSINSAVMMLAFFIGYLFGGYLPSLFMTIRSGLALVTAQKYSLYLAVLISASGVVPILSLTQKPVQRVKTRWIEKIKGYDWHIIWKLMLPKILVGLGAGLIIPFMNLYFKTIFKLPDDQIGMCYSAMQLMVFVAMLIAPLCTRWLGVVKTIVVTELVSIPFMLILALTHNFWLALMAFVLRGALMNLSIPVSTTFEMELVKPEDQPVTNAISQLSWTGSWALSAQVGGIIIKHISFAASFYVTIVFYLISAICYYVLFRNAVPHASHREIPEPESPALPA